jgi:predicted transporter
MTGAAIPLIGIIWLLIVGAIGLATGLGIGFVGFVIDRMINLPLASLNVKWG